MPIKVGKAQSAGGTKGGPTHLIEKKIRETSNQMKIALTSKSDFSCFNISSTSERSFVEPIRFAVCFECEKLDTIFWSEFITSMNNKFPFSRTLRNII